MAQLHLLCSFKVDFLSGKDQLSNRTRAVLEKQDNQLVTRGALSAKLSYPLI